MKGSTFVVMDKDTTQAKLYEHYLGFFLPEGMLDFFELVWLAPECRFCALCPANPLRLRSMCRPRNIHPSVETAVSRLRSASFRTRLLSSAISARVLRPIALRCPSGHSRKGCRCGSGNERYGQGIFTGRADRGNGRSGFRHIQ